MAIRFLLLAALLTGCATTDTDNRAQETVFKAEAALNVALASAVQYANLPRCPTNEPMCSDNAILDKIVAAEQVASTALLSAERVVRDPNATDSAVNSALGAANTALATLTALTAALPTLGVN